MLFPVHPTNPAPTESLQWQSMDRTTSVAGHVLRSEVLFAGRQSIEIEHNGQRYRLQTTKSGKLILTK